MSELNLTNEQVVELATMGVAGEMAADELHLWRVADFDPWPSDGYELAKYLVHCCRCEDVDGDRKESEYNFDNHANSDAIAHARNTAELRAACLYWETNQMRALMPTIVDAGTLRVLAEKVDAIAKAYAEIKQ